MSHYTRISDGKYIMTEVNALRHYIRLAKHAMLINDISYMEHVYNEATYHIDVDKCYKCPYDDFGYCYFRGSNSIQHDEEYRICFNNWIKSMQHELNTMLQRKGKLKGIN